jgi:hypothetical protein
MLGLCRASGVEDIKNPRLQRRGFFHLAHRLKTIGSSFTCKAPLLKRFLIIAGDLVTRKTPVF